jgi:signal transduction histidine kinase
MLVAAMWLFRRRIMRPLAELREAVRRIGEGELELRLTVRHEDELGLLARTLQAMTGRLRAQQEDLEERVAQRTNELLRTARLADLGTLAAGVAHEINNPLAAIATCAEGLLRDEQRALARNGPPAFAHDPADGRERIREYLGIIAKEAMRVRDTTARLLAFARPESGRREPVWLQREVREVATMLDHSATRAGVTLDLDLAQNTPPVLGDPADLRQVAFNLLKNALDASSHGGAVAIRVNQRDDNVVLEVEDHGHGVAAEIRDRVFEPFVTTKAPGDGTGLGLAISHRIVTDHGGSLRLHTPTRGGACFTVTLPRLR